MSQSTEIEASAKKFLSELKRCHKAASAIELNTVNMERWLQLQTALVNLVPAAAAVSILAVEADDAKEAFLAARKGLEERARELKAGEEKLEKEKAAFEKEKDEVLRQWAVVNSKIPADPDATEDEEIPADTKWAHTVTKDSLPSTITAPLGIAWPTIESKLDEKTAEIIWLPLDATNDNTFVKMLVAKNFQWRGKSDKYCTRCKIDKKKCDGNQLACCGRCATHTSQQPCVYELGENYLLVFNQKTGLLPLPSPPSPVASHSDDLYD